ncbi:MAG: HAD family hydrolase [Firmicutes bacterium]|nr:HAD family hydrolase [Bacillota bacterium]
MLLIFDLDDTLLHTHRVFVELTEAFLARMAELGFDDDNVYYTLDSFDCEIIEDADAYVSWAFPKAMRKTYEFYCDKFFEPVDEAEAEALEQLGFGFRYAEYELIPHAKQVLDELAEDGHRLVLLTQGGYEEQKFKVEQHLLNEFFDEIVVVDKKTPAVYANVMERHGFAAKDTVVIGNSPKSEVLPALAVGARPILVRVTDSWNFEEVTLPENVPVVNNLSAILELLR